MWLHAPHRLSTAARRSGARRGNALCHISWLVPACHTSGDCPSICEVHLSVHLSIRLSVCLPACLSVCLSVCPSVHLSVCPAVRVSVRLSVSPCLSVCLPRPVRPSARHIVTHTRARAHTHTHTHTPDTAWEDVSRVCSGSTCANLVALAATHLLIQQPPARCVHLAMSKTLRVREPGEMNLRKKSRASRLSQSRSAQCSPPGRYLEALTLAFRSSFKMCMNRAFWTRSGRDGHNQSPQGTIGGCSGDVRAMECRLRLCAQFARNRRANELLSTRRARHHALR